MSVLEVSNKPLTDVMTLNTKFWTNHLIWDKIISCLSVADLKALSLVNKEFLDKVRRIPRLVFKETLKGNLQVCAPVLNKAIVEVSNVDEYYLEHFGSDVFENVTHLELQRFGRMLNNVRNRIFKRIICSSTMLKSLAFGARNFFTIDYQDLFRDEETKQILSRLDELHIGIQNDNYDGEYDYDELDSIELDDEDNLLKNEGLLDDEDTVPFSWCSDRDSDTDPLENFKIFPDLDLKLKKFTFRDPDDLNNSSTYFYPDLMLESSLNFLVEIDLHIHMSGLEHLKTIYIPNLKTLKLSVFGICMKNVTTIVNYDFDREFCNNLIPFFTRHLKTLQIVSLYSEMPYSVEPLCNILKNSKTIREISLKGDRNFIHSNLSMKWDFLQTLSTLKSFEFQLFSEDRSNNMVVAIRSFVHLASCSDALLNHVYNILAVLPSTVTSIRLFGLPNKIGPMHCQMTGSLQRFQNLTELSLLRCTEFLLDHDLQFICRQLKTLRILKGDFDKITDYGISGCHSDGTNSAVSLKNLAGLKELVISSSYPYHFEITWKGLLNSVKFLELHYLAVQRPLKYPHGDGKQDGLNYLKLIQQNPSLETCELKFYMPNRLFREKALKLNPRLKWSRLNFDSSELASVLNSVL